MLEVVLEDFGADEDDHGAADVDEILKPVLVRQNRVPEAQDVRQREFLAQQQRQPPEGVILRENSLLPQPVEHRKVTFLQKFRELVHHAANPVLRLVEGLYEEVSDLAHQRREAPETVGFRKLGVIVVRREDVINGSDDFVHSLHVSCG